MDKRKLDNLIDLVKKMVHHMIDCHYTPSEMREAAILASIIYQEHYVRPQLLPTEVLNWLDGKEDSDGR